MEKERQAIRKIIGEHVKDCPSILSLENAIISFFKLEKQSVSTNDNNEQKRELLMDYEKFISNLICGEEDNRNEKSLVNAYLDSID